jgi:hypothetical protein
MKVRPEWSQRLLRKGVLGATHSAVGCVVTLIQTISLRSIRTMM